MPTRSCKLGLVLPEGLHARMVASAASPLSGFGARGRVQAAYALAFEALLRRLDDGQPVTFAVVRGRKVRVTLRLPEPLCERIRLRLDVLDLKLTDFAFAAVDRWLTPNPGD